MRLGLNLGYAGAAAAADTVEIVHEAQRLLIDAAEHGHWELDRLRLYPDGTRKVTLRRRIIRMRSTLVV